MGKLFNELKQDILYQHGMNACLNCGVCTAVCPAAEFNDYSPREVMNIVQSEDDELIEELLKSDKIWYCGQCFSCKTRCPRGNNTASIVLALRRLSIRYSYFAESEKGRQQLFAKRVFGADCIVLACPLCSTNLELRQPDIEKKYNVSYNLPVLYITEIIGLALGIKPGKLGINKHIISPKPILAKLGI